MPILKAEKVNRHPASNKRHPHPTPPPSHSHSNLNKRPLPCRYPPKEGISTNLRLPRRQSFLQSVLQKYCFVASSCFVITIYCFLAKYAYYTCWKWWKFNKCPALNKHPPQISAHSQGPKILLAPRAVNRINTVCWTNFFPSQFFLFFLRFYCSQFIKLNFPLGQDYSGSLSCYHKTCNRFRKVEKKELPYSAVSVSA